MNGLGGSGHILTFPTANSIMLPRIYLYKITFEEIPDWYWGIHKEKRFGETYLGSPVTHAWKWNFYTPVLQILQEFEYSERGWKEAEELETRLIRPDLNNPLCLNEHCGGRPSTEARARGGETTKENNIAIFAPGISHKGGVKTQELGVGIHAPGMAALGGSIAGRQNVELKRGLFAEGNQSKGGRNSANQKWRCLVTGHISNPGGLTSYQRHRNIDTSLRERI